VLNLASTSDKTAYSSDKLYLFLETYKYLPEGVLSQLLLTSLAYLNQQITAATVM
jgi:hypothetical protein